MVFMLLVIIAMSVGADSVSKGQCQLNLHPSVEYRCYIGTGEDTRVCGAQEPAGTVVNPKCATNYYSPDPLRYMLCFGGDWSYIAKCIPECGTVSPAGEVMVVGGERVKRGELPWHAGIYRKTETPYEQVCGGSLISNRVVVSAAHCFWTDLEKQLPASQFAVALGKLSRQWGDLVDQAQKSDVKEIHLPLHFRGAETNFQADIAILIVTNKFQLNQYVLPVCIDFEIIFEAQQLRSGNLGKVAGWGLTAANGNPSPVLRVVELPFVELGTCFTNSPPNFRKFITNDKICAGTLQSDTAVCRGDSGGGLAFAETHKGTERYYLRGIVSTAPSNDDHCNTAAYTSFTQLSRHEHFVKQYWIESPEAGSCILPPYPEHGAYTADIAGAEPGQGYERVTLSNVTCERGYALRVSTSREFSCSHGVWTGSAPRCVSICGGSLIPGNVSGYEFSDRTSHCYKFHTRGAGWADANRTCVAEGARLAVANSEAEERVLVELYQRYPDEAIHDARNPHCVYVGIYRQDGVWRTVDGQTLAQAGHAHWGRGAPSVRDGLQYADMHRDGIIFNWYGSNKYAFICEMA